MTLEDYQSKINALSDLKSMINKIFFESETNLRIGDWVKVTDHYNTNEPVKTKIRKYDVMYNGDIFLTVDGFAHCQFNIKNVQKCREPKNKTR